MDAKQFEQQSSQVLCLSANLHFMDKVKKYMQNGQLLQSKVNYKSNCRLISLQFDQNSQVKLTQNVQLIQAAIKTHAKVEDHCDSQCEYLHYQKFSYERLQWATKLPVNLMPIFRLVAMSVPGNELIAKVMMFAEGF